MVEKKTITDEQILLLREAKSLVTPIKSKLTYEQTESWIKFLHLREFKAGILLGA